MSKELYKDLTEKLNNICININKEIEYDDYDYNEDEIYKTYPYHITNIFKYPYIFEDIYENDVIKKRFNERI